MVIDFSRIDVQEPPVLVLRTLSGIEIQTLGYAYNLEASLCYNEISQIKFDVPAYVDGVKTPNYDRITGMMEVDLVGYGIFVLVNPSVKNDGIKEIKSCVGYSREYEFTKKKIALPSSTYNFYNPADINNTILGIILEYMPDWSIGSVDDDLVGKYRTFEINYKSIYDFIKSEIQNSYQCVFDFDTYNRKINVKSVSGEVPVSPIFLSTDNLVKEFEINEDTDNVYTCLDVNGSEGVNIRAINPLGTNKIYNLDYYMNADNFTEDIIEKWNAWKDNFEINRQLYYDLTIEQSLQTSKYLTLSAAKNDLEGQLQSFENIQSTYIQNAASGDDSEYFQTKMEEVKEAIALKKQEILAKESEIEFSLNRINEITESLKNINNDVSFSSFFNEDDMSKIRPYIIEDAIEETSFVVKEVNNYDYSGITNLCDRINVSITESKIDKVSNKMSKDMYTVRNGILEITYGAHTYNATIMNASGYKDQTDGEIVLSFRLGHGSGYDVVTDKDFEFESGSISIVCTAVGSIIDDTAEDTGIYTGTQMSFEAKDAQLFFTRNTTAYEKYSVEKELYDYGVDTLNKLSNPSYSFTVDVENFLALDDFISFSTQLRLGRKDYLDINMKVIQPILIGVEIDFSDLTKLKLSFGDTYSSSDSSFKLVDLLEKSVSMGKNVDFSKYTYNAFVDSGASTSVKEFMNSALDVSKNAILSSGGQGISWDDSGLHLRKIIEGTQNYEDEQIWMINNNIVFTEDNWSTVKMAIGKFKDTNAGDVWGIAAPNIVGTLLAGSNLVIDTENGSFKVDNNGVQIDSLKFFITHNQTDSNGNVIQVKESFEEVFGNINSNVSDKLKEILIENNGTYVNAEKISGIISAQKSQMQSSNGNVLFDKDGLWLMNRPSRSLATEAVWINEDGIMIGTGSATGDESDPSISPSWNWSTAISSAGIMADAIMSGGTLSGVHIAGGSLNIGNGTFVVDDKGNITATSGTFKGIIKGATYQDADGNKMVFSSDYLDLKGLTIRNDEGTKTFEIDSNGNVYFNLNGSISFRDLSDADEITTAIDTANNAASEASDAYSIASSASSLARKIANGTYSGGTFIDGTTIYSPTIISDEFIAKPKTKTGTTGGFSLYGYVNSTLYHMLKIYFYYGDGAYINFTSPASGSANWNFPATYFKGSLDFSGATVTGLSSSDSIAVFG